MNNQNRAGIIDLYRLVGALIIMTHHLGDIVGGWTPWRGGWIYCEFFFIITGFYTARHFYGGENKNRAREALLYTVHKFWHYFPYTTIAIFLIYIIKCRGVASEGAKAVVYYFMDMPFEMLYVKSVRLGPMWFLCAMFLAFPLFTLFSQIRNKYIICMGSAMYVIWYYYSLYDLHSETSWKRALAGMMLGAFIFYVDDILKEEVPQYTRGGNKRKLMLTLMECIFLMLPMVYSFFTDPEFHIVILFFAAGLGIALTGKSYSADMKSDVVQYLGKVSMPLYIFHAVVIGIINIMDIPGHEAAKIAIYYAGSVIVACIFYYLVELVAVHL